MSEKRIASTPKVFQVTARPIKRHSPSPNASNQSSTILNTSAKRVATAPTTIPKVTLPPTQPTIVTNQGVFQVKLVSDNAQSTSSTPSNLLIQPQSLQKTFNSKTITLMPRSNLQKIAPSAIPSNVRLSMKLPKDDLDLIQNNPIMKGIMNKLDPPCLPSYIVVHTVHTLKTVKCESVQTNEISLANSQTMTDSSVYQVDRNIQCNLKLATVKKRSKAIQCYIRTKRKDSSDSDRSTDEDRAEDLIFAPRTKKDYTNKYRQIDENTFECTICGLRKNTSYVLVRHIRGHDEKSTLCQFCGKIMGNNTKTRLLCHEQHCRKRGGRRRSVSQDSKETLERICPYCKRVSKSYITHMDHINAHTKERPNVCSCGVRFGSVYNLYVHRSNFGCSAKGSYSPYVTDIEDEQSGKRRQLLRTKRKAMLIPPQPQTKRVITRNRRLKHKRNKNKISFTKPFKGQCDVCGQGFTNKECLARHRTLHDERRFICQECNGAYSSTRRLREHIKSHLNRVKCEYCKNLVRSSHYESHLDRHKGQFSIECKFCDAKFFSKAGLRRHMQNFHKYFFCALCRLEAGSKPNRHLTNKRHLALEKAWKEKHKLEQFPCIRCFDSHFNTFLELSMHTQSSHHSFIYNRMDRVLKKIVEYSNQHCDKPVKGNDDKQKDGTIQVAAREDNNSSPDSNLEEDSSSDFTNICKNFIETEEIDIKEFNFEEAVKMIESNHTANPEHISKASVSEKTT